MDAFGHAVITLFVSDSPLAAAASAVRLRYRNDAVEQLYRAVPEEYRALALGAASHIEGNKYVHSHLIFSEMRAEARETLRKHSIRDVFSHVAMEIAVDELVRKEYSSMLEEAWNSAGWEIMGDLLPRFAPDENRAKGAISFVGQRLHSNGYGAGWLAHISERYGVQIEESRSAEAMAEIGENLRKLPYQELLRQAGNHVEEKMQAGTGAFQYLHRG